MLDMVGPIRGYGNIDEDGRGYGRVIVQAKTPRMATGSNSYYFHYKNFPFPIGAIFSARFVICVKGGLFAYPRVKNVDSRRKDGGMLNLSVGGLDHNFNSYLILEYW
ncbi:MAG TPA: hypothetical protein DEA08_25150 [Planctomycetes bacterium]|nr:hypothetical protein [Planctomycetota bacterium]